MIRWLLGLLFIANVLFFSVMYWGSGLTVDVDALKAQAPLNADKIRLLSEIPSSVVSADVLLASSVVAQSSVLAPNKKANNQCMEWGEFSGGGLEKVKAELAKLNLGNRMAQRTLEHESGFWVYIAPLKSSVEVQRKIEQLKQRGVTDYFVVQESGEWLNAISLGVFRTEEAAQKYLMVMRDKSVISAKVGARKSKLKSTVFELKDLDAVLSAGVREVSKQFPDNVLKVVDCN
ncbi:MAG: SPOR domain-containing protein [Sideroxydans sp.]|nr:SPOR domain-containing protein [Sideroxydans sp.]